MWLCVYSTFQTHGSMENCYTPIHYYPQKEHHLPNLHGRCYINWGRYGSKKTTPSRYQDDLQDGQCTFPSLTSPSWRQRCSFGNVASFFGGRKGCAGARVDWFKHAWIIKNCIVKNWSIIFFLKERLWCGHQVFRIYKVNCWMKSVNYVNGLEW